MNTSATEMACEFVRASAQCPPEDWLRMAAVDMCKRMVKDGYAPEQALGLSRQFLDQCDQHYPYAQPMDTLPPDYDRRLSAHVDGWQGPWAHEPVSDVEEWKLTCFSSSNEAIRARNRAKEDEALRLAGYDVGPPDSDEDCSDLG